MSPAMKRFIGIVLLLASLGVAAWQALLAA